MDLGQSQLFTSTVSGGTSPYSYQWYLNGAPINGATSSSWVFTPPSQGSYIQIYVKITDNVGVQATSNTATVNANLPPSVNISPTSATIGVGQSQQFASSVSGSTPPYSYQWCLNGVIVPGATSPTWTFTPGFSGSYSVYLNVTDNVGFTVESNTASVTVSGAFRLTVSSAHDSPSPSVGVHTYNDGSSVTCSVTSPVTEGGTVWNCTGWSGTGSVPSSGSLTSVTFTISQGSTITWNWQGAATQWKLTVSSAHDSPSPSIGDHLYSDGSSVTCSVMSPVTEGGVSYTCTGWSGTGSVPSSGSGTYAIFIITQDSTITWNWIVTPPVQFRLTVSSVHDSPNPGVGDHYYSDGQSVTCTVSTPVTEGNITYVCTGWSGTGSVPSNGSGRARALTCFHNILITVSGIHALRYKSKARAASHYSEIH